MNDSWLTPQSELDRFTKIAGPISTDPFWHPKSFTKPQRAFTISNRLVNNRTVFYNGFFFQMWIGRSIWINCPYSDPLPCMQAAEKYHIQEPKAIIGILLNSATETRAFSIARRIAKFRIEFLYRVGFIDPFTMRKVEGNQYSQTLFLVGPVKYRAVLAAYSDCHISRGPIHAP